jgi:hypothetical protein
MNYVLFILLCSSSVFAADVPEMQEKAVSFLSLLTDGNMFAKIVAFGLAVQIVLYALGEALTRVSVYTDNKWDNDVAAKVSSIAWYLGLIISKFGYSVPKLVIEEKAKKLEDKKGD